MDTIKSNTEVSRVFKQGKRFSTPYLSLIVLDHTHQHGQSGRVVFIAGKKSGNAVWRNRAKRRMRALCRELQGPWDGYDVIFLANRQIDRACYSKVLAACRNVLDTLR